jgi:hypothetical protein
VNLSFLITYLCVKCLEHNLRDASLIMQESFIDLFKLFLSFQP